MLAVTWNVVMLATADYAQCKCSWLINRHCVKFIHYKNIEETCSLIRSRLIIAFSPLKGMVAEAESW